MTLYMLGYGFSYCQNLSLNDILKLVFVLFLTLEIFLYFKFVYFHVILCY